MVCAWPALEGGDNLGSTLTHSPCLRRRLTPSLVVATRHRAWKHTPRIEYTGQVAARWVRERRIPSQLRKPAPSLLSPMWPIAHTPTFNWKISWGVEAAPVFTTWRNISYLNIRVLAKGQQKTLKKNPACRHMGTLSFPQVYSPLEEVSAINKSSCSAIEMLRN